MGVDYVQDRQCRVKEALGVETLVQLLKSRAQAASLVRQAEEKGTDPAGATVKRVVRYPGGPVEEDVPLADLLAAGETLAPYEPVCEACTANFQQAPFGCCGYLSYPISEAEEQWIMTRLPASPRSVAGIYLRNVLRELEIDGRPVAQMRETPFFERAAPVVRTWDGGSEPLAVSSNQLFQFLFFAGPIDPVHAVFACLFLGLIPHEIPPADLQAILRTPDAIQHHLAIDGQTLELLEETQLGQFLMGMMSAALHGETLLVNA